MIRSKFSIKAALLAGGIGLSLAGVAGSQPAAAQSYFGEYSCPAGYVYDPTYGSTPSGQGYEPDDFGYYGYSPYGTYGSYYGGHREFGHGLGHGMAVGANHAAGIARPGGDFDHGMAGGFRHGSGVARFGGGFGHGIGGGFDHGAGFTQAGGFGHGMAGGFHGGGGGHR